jgi:hypothetical protein
VSFERAKVASLDFALLRERYASSLVDWRGAAEREENAAVPMVEDGLEMFPPLGWAETEALVRSERQRLERLAREGGWIV